MKSWEIKKIIVQSLKKNWVKLYSVCGAGNKKHQQVGNPEAWAPPTASRHGRVHIPSPTLRANGPHIQQPNRRGKEPCEAHCESAESWVWNLFCYVLTANRPTPPPSPGKHRGGLCGQHDPADMTRREGGGWQRVPCGGRGGGTN